MEKLTTSQQRYLEGYAAALQDIQLRLTGNNWCSKSYDPMTCESAIIHSYAFNLKSGGRHHEVREFKSLEEIKTCLLDESTTAVLHHNSMLA
jgi:hypothetical protein